MERNKDEFSKEDRCIHNLGLKMLSSIAVANVKPLFNYDYVTRSQNIVIACGADIKVFTVKSGECIQTMKLHSRPVVGLQENKKNMLQFFSCSDDGIVVRWDYTGQILQVYELQIISPVTCFYVSTPDGEWFFTKKFKDTYQLYSLMPKEKRYKQILKSVLPKENSIAIGLMDKYLASVYGNTLTIYKLDERSVIRHKTGVRKLTCVACHPSEYVLATGDHFGQVIIWTNAFNSRDPIRSIHHWHSNAVGDLAFTAEGSHIYSGGSESTLLKWNLFYEEKSILPRLGAPIKYIVAAKDNNYVMTAHSDNVLQVINAQRNIVLVIQGITKSELLYDKVLPVGLLYNAHLKSLVTNGKPGHLQFYDLQQDKMMFNLDIACRNFISQDRETAVQNIDIQKAALDDLGLWLASTEYWCDSDSSPQIWLKFWQFDLEKQTFTLNTNAYLPHRKDLNCIIFKPYVKKLDESPLVVTTSNDSYFKIWTLNTIENESHSSWGCEYTGSYRDMIPSSATFNEDGSVLAVAFGCAATLWKVNNPLLKGVLVHKNSKRDIKQLLFGHHADFKYLVCHDGFSITSWDCTSFSIVWSIQFEIQLLVADMYSSNIAAFCKDQNLKIFKASNPQPLDCVRKVSDTPIVSAVFVPSSTSNNIKGCFKEKSQLYFMDSSQNMLTVVEFNKEKETTPAKKSVAQNIKETPFGLLQAEHTVSDVKIAKVEEFDISMKEEQSDIISNPTWVDPEVMLKSVLSRMLKKKIEEELDETEKEVCVVEREENTSEVIIKFTLEDDWMSKEMNRIGLQSVDFTSLVEQIKFVN